MIIQDVEVSWDCLLGQQTGISGGLVGCWVNFCVHAKINYYNLGIFGWLHLIFLFYFENFLARVHMCSGLLVDRLEDLFQLFYLQRPSIKQISR